MVDKELLYNASGYKDETMYMAAKNIERGKKMNITKGEIYEIKQNNGNLKDVVIISAHRTFSTVLTLSDDAKLPYKVICTGIKYTNPAQLSYCFNDQLRAFKRTMSEKEFTELKHAVLKSLGYELKDVEAVEKPVIKPMDIKNNPEFIRVQIERDTYRDFYFELLDNLFSATKGE